MEFFDKNALEKAISFFETKSEKAFYEEVGGGKARYRMIEREGKRYPQKAIGVLATRYHTGSGSTKDFNTNYFNKVFEDYGFELIGKFDPKDTESISSEVQRQERLAKVLTRSKQAQLRAKLLNTYRCCMVTGFSHELGLQAAHIVPVKQDGADKLGNALLLRADVHLLFDANVIRFDPSSLAVIGPERLLEELSCDKKRFKSAVRDGGYEAEIRKSLAERENRYQK